jgi:hypothetical protein
VEAGESDVWQLAGAAQMKVKNNSRRTRRCKAEDERSMKTILKLRVMLPESLALSLRLST